MRAPKISSSYSCFHLFFIILVTLDGNLDLGALVQPALAFYLEVILETTVCSTDVMQQMISSGTKFKCGLMGSVLSIWPLSSL